MNLKIVTISWQLDRHRVEQIQMPTNPNSITAFATLRVSPWLMDTSYLVVFLPEMGNVNLATWQPHKVCNKDSLIEV